ncbi:hypothetical protein [Pseudomonas chlororaphis]|uniref:hypothetical protein n=1 Tax=Pseudomonas chlororaphis TaxID=587753 RepID=UPI000F55E2A1|nr:hypothetical protein [Pseudomonas chlororaphis]AZE22508.1 hypothetical protein C4K08_2071 [Pseudomonas chlororaphis subsp. aureofaciens]
MADVESNYEDEEFEEQEISPQVLAEAKEKIAARCAASGITFEEVVDEIADSSSYKFGFKCGRNVKHILVWGAKGLLEFLDVPFEDYCFLSDLDAICSYKDGVIEAGIRPVSFNGQGVSIPFVYRQLFGVFHSKDFDSEENKLIVSAEGDNPITFEISPGTHCYKTIAQNPGRQGLTLKLSGVNIKQHDKAVELLTRSADSLLFQLDLLTNVPFILRKQRRRSGGRLIRRVRGAEKVELKFPDSEFDSAPLSLYWYGRSADEMPLLQFLAYYQVVEFYFPIYSQSEAQRKLKAILKNPTFRGDRDSDVARLLTAIQVSRNGTFGDERSQLKATMIECVDADSIREFIESDSVIKEFYLSGSKSLPFHKIPLANESLDLRGDIAERIYDIRCRIVHTKSDSRDVSGELLLPFSKEAELLGSDIKLMQYIARQVLIAGSRAYHV